MCATLHNHTLVKRGELVGATRALPLIMKHVAIQRATAIASQNGGVVSVKPLQKTRAGLVITGNEVYHGLIQDRFAPTLTGKIEALGSEVAALEFAPDDAEAIAGAIRAHLERGCDLLLLSGGMSVDPDDVTRHGIRLAGATEMHYGAAVLPGAMFLVAYLGEVPLLGVPACALHHRSTALDLVLHPDSGGRAHRQDRTGLSGARRPLPGLPGMPYPHCSFGKG